MGVIRYFTILVLLLLNFLGAIYLETRMKTNFTLEIVLIVLGIIVAFMVLIGLVFETKWVWPLATILFAANLANAVFLYFNVRTFLVFSGMLFFNLLGMLVSVVSIGDEDDFMSETSDSFPLDTYDTEPDEVVYKTKRTSAKKKKKKKK